MRSAGWLAIAAWISLGQPVWASDAIVGQRCLNQSDLECAQRVLVEAQRRAPTEATTLHLEARTRFFEGRYSEAVAALDRLDALGVSEFDEEEPYRATLAASEGFVSTTGRGVVVRSAPGLDAVLVEEAVETLEHARSVIDPLLGGGPKHPIVLDIFPDGRRFVDASGLPPDAVRTTGVVALSKWTRLLLTSPRALSRGYAWKDTVAHEYIHLVVAWRTHDKAPVWLQEGLAKHLEGFWRGEKSGHLSAHQQGLLARAIRGNSFVPFEKFRLSMAYLDSGEEAALAFAQVATMVGYLIDQGGERALSGVLDQVAEGVDPGEAVAHASGHRSFLDFREGWLAWVQQLPLVQDQLAALPVVLDGEGGDFADDPLLAGRPDLARYARIGDLLRDSGRHQAALVEYEKAQDPEGPPSPLLLARQALCEAALGDKARALEMAERGATLYPEFALLLTTYATLLEGAGRPTEALTQWVAAHDLNPFDPAVQAAIVRLAEATGDRALAARHQRYVKLLASGGMAKVEAARSSD